MFLRLYRAESPGQSNVLPGLNSLNREDVVPLMVHPNANSYHVQSIYSVGEQFNTLCHLIITSILGDKDY